MWNGLWMLLLLSIVMGTASFLAGLLPLSFSLTSRQLRLMTALGTGVLVGTSLIVIIPEGVETLYSADSRGLHSQNMRGSVLNARNAAPMVHLVPRTDNMDRMDTRTGVAMHPHDGGSSFRSGPDDGWDDADALRKSSVTDTKETPTDSGDEKQYHAEEKHESGDNKEFEPHVWIGISLVLGFILMYLIDTLPRTATSSSRPQRFPISLNQFSLNRTSVDETPGSPMENMLPATSSASVEYQSKPSSTTAGLVIHSAADGIALGASSATAGSDLSFMVFTALVIHKAPAAFGLTSVLLKQGLSKRMAKIHLAIFSLAAPVGALLTWAVIHLFGSPNSTIGESAGSGFATGVLLLFSGGTFLYVAMHTMQGSGPSGHCHDESNVNGYAGATLNDSYTTHTLPPAKPQGLSLMDTLVTVVGMLLPLFAQGGHAH